MGFVDLVVMKTSHLDPHPPRASAADGNPQGRFTPGRLPPTAPLPIPRNLTPFPTLLPCPHFGGGSPHAAKPISKCKLVTPSPPRLLESPLSLRRGEAPRLVSTLPRIALALFTLTSSPLRPRGWCLAQGHHAGPSHLLGKVISLDQN